MSMTNKERLEKQAKKNNSSIGFYNPKLEMLNQANLKKVISNITIDNAVIPVYVDRIKHLVLIDPIENKINLDIKNKKEYEKEFNNTKKWSDYRW